MSKKYMSRPPYCSGAIPDYNIPPMTVEEYKYYEKEFFGFLEDTTDKPVKKQVHIQAEQPGIFRRFLQFVGISKISKDEDAVPPFKCKSDFHDVDNETSDSRLAGMGDNLKGEACATVTKPVVRMESKSTQTEDVATCDQGVQTEKCKGGFLKSCRRFFRRSFKCLKTGEE